MSDFNKILEDFKNFSDEELTQYIDNLDEQSIINLRKTANPYGRTVTEAQGKYTCMSIVNLKEKYLQKFLMTSLIGFLYRQCDEYKLDDGEPTTPLDDFKNFMTQMDNALKKAKGSSAALKELDKEDPLDSEARILRDAQRLEHERNISRAEGFKQRLVIRQFIDNLFQYNPDKHVRSAYSDNDKDPERVKPKQVKVIKGRNGEIKVLKPAKHVEQVERSESPLVKHIPPADTFHRWEYYIDSNYEEIKDAVTDLYSEKSDIEFAINPYKEFDSKDEVNSFVQKYQNEVITDIKVLNNGSWNLMGSFKENRDRVDFYNKNTAVLKEILNQIEEDKKLGADLMRKRVKRKKKKNIEECGEEPKEFKQYRKDHSSGFEELGAEDMSRHKDKESKHSFEVHEDFPYDAVQVDVFDFRKGGQVVNKGEFFTEAEAPIEKKI